jgi:hypothetical protein
MSNVHVVDALTRETRSDLLSFLLNIEDQRQKSLDIRWWYIVSIRSLDQRLAFEVKNRDQGRHESVNVVGVRGVPARLGVHFVTYRTLQILCPCRAYTVCGHSARRSNASDPLLCTTCSKNISFSCQIRSERSTLSCSIELRQ